ncbi:acyltransferase family protein [Microbispora sp. ZYX-F-249]|uniref:Acyltransferase family protein n=1 Tax=Microbispora maris TaxID=3144104 RepID=A0ABV0AZB4_9ACTN
MSDTRHHPPVPGSPQGNDPDAEEAPTGVIGRITGDWPAPDGGLPRREPKPAGDPEGEQGAGGPAGERPEHGRHESVLSAPVDESTAAPAHGRHESDESAPGSAAGPAAEARGGTASYDKPYEKQPLPTRKPRGAEGPGGIPHSSIPKSASPTGSAPTGSAPAGAASQDTPYEKQPLPVRKPRKPGASRLGMPPASAPQAEGFDYFGRGQERPGVPRVAAASDGPARPQAFPEHGPRNLSDAFPGGGRRSSGLGHPDGAGTEPGFGQRDGSGLRGGSDAPTPPFGDSPAFPAPAFGAAPPFPEPPGFPEPPSSFPEPPGFPQQPAAAAGRTANPFLDTPPSGVGPAFPPDDPFGAAPPFPETTRGRSGGRDFPDAFPGAAPNAAFGSASAPEAPAPAWPGQEADPARFDPWRRSSQDDTGGPGDPRQTGPLGRPLRAPLPAWAEVPLRPDDAFARGEGRNDGLDNEPEQEPAPRAKKPRDPYLDNVKFVGIALVPIGHALVPTLAADSARATYLFIYVFHMPLFVIISGYLSRNFWNSNAKTNKLVDTFLVPYVIVEVGYALLRTAFGHKFSLTIMDPAWLNWYLLALLFWRLSTPVWKRMKHPFLISVAVYLFAGFSELSGDFSMDRFFGLLPFFVLGLVLKPEVFDFLKQRWVMMLSVVVLLGAAGVAIFLVKNYSVKLGPIYYKDSYKDLHLVWWKGMLLRTGLLVAALAMSAAVMSLIPRRQTWFTDLGTRTLYCYLLHGVPVMIAKEMGWVSFPWLYGPLGVAAIAASGFALAIVLCLPVTRAAFKWLLEPRLTWLYRRPSGQAPKPVSTGS